jgi:antitoxin VapB
MSLNIKKPEAHALAERLAKLTGETLTEAVTTALRERLARLENVSAIDEERYWELKALIKGSRELWREPFLSVDHGDLLYDERGLPK